MSGVPTKVLIIKPSALGDVVQALPVACGLKKNWPSAQVHWLINESYQELLADHPCIDHVIPYPRSRWKSLAALPEISRWSKQLKQEKYDLVIDLQGLARSGYMTKATGSERRLGLRSAREGASFAYNEIIHDYPLAAAERYLCALAHLGIEGQADDFQLSSKAPLPNSLTKKTYIVFHPYSRWETKLWPWRYYQQLANMLPELTCVIVGQGPWFPLFGKNIVDLRGTLPLPELMAILEQARFVLSTDSGPAHLAAALKTPTLVLFGATDSRKTAPAAANATVQRYPVSCSPCLKRTCSNPDQMACMVGITPDSIRNKVEEILASAS